jgi:hypothetical protein
MRRRNSIAERIEEQLEKAAAAGKLLPGRAYTIDILHEKHCPTLKGLALDYCNCEPDIRPVIQVPCPEDN